MPKSDTLQADFLPGWVRLCVILTDVLFLTYWAVSLADVAGLLTIPPEAMYGDYRNPVVVAWNWSFFPLDVLFSVLGLWGVRVSRRDAVLAFGLLTTSLALTFCAGLMAVSFWALKLEFAPEWWIPNLIIMLWPIPAFAAMLRRAKLQIPALCP